MNFSEITSFLWGTADLLRNTYKQHEYGSIILPFTVMRRVDIALMPTKEKVLEVDSNTPKDSKFRESKLMKAAGNIGFYNTSKFTMESLRDEPDDIQSNLVNYIAGFSPDMLDVFDKFGIYDVIKKLDAIFDDFRIFVKVTEKLRNAQELLRKDAEDFDWENL